jgi:hypothetical protein
MATAPGALIRSVPQQALLSTPLPDGGAGSDVQFVSDPYAALYTQPKVRKSHALALEGSYYVAGQAAGIVPTYATAFSATTPFITVYNGNVVNKNICLDYVALTNIVAGVCTTAVGYQAIAVSVDSINRYTSGGTSLGAGVNCNMAYGASSGAVINCGAITATAASVNGRLLSPTRIVRPGVTTLLYSVIGDLIFLNFGGVEGVQAGNIVIANPCIVPMSLPPVVIPPGSTALIYWWTPVLTAPSAATFAPEIGFWVR